MTTILLVPTYNGSINFELWSESIYRMNPLPDKVIFCENNSFDNTLENISSFKLPHEVIRVWFREDISKYLEDEEKWEYATIAHARQLLLTRAKRLDPDYAIFIDDDTLPPKDLIKLVQEDKKIILGGLYQRIFVEGIFLATKFYHPVNEQRMKRMYFLADYNHMMNNLDAYMTKYLEWSKFVHLPLMEVPMTSGGCLALSREAIRHPQLYFYPDPCKKFEIVASEDFGYCMRARHYGIRTFVDLRILCRHLFDVRTIRPWAIDSKTKKLVVFEWGHKALNNTMDKL